MSLKLFGQKLREVRNRAGLTQAELARRLSVSAELISIWERAYQYRGRTWKPDRPSVVRLVEIFADQLSPEEAQAWVSLAGYKLGQAKLQGIFPTYSVQTSLPHPPPLDYQTNLKRLEMPPEQRLFGVGSAQQQLYLILDQAEPPWLIAIDGIGGIGKTSLASALTRAIMPTGRFYDMAWISAKQEEFFPGHGIRQLDRPALDTGALVNTLLEQLIRETPSSASPEEKLAILTGLLKQQSYLIVIDNLETVTDYKTLLPLLRKLANPSKFLLTSRHSLYADSDVFNLSLKELNRTDTLALLQYEAQVRGLPALAEASQTQLESIYQVAGGNPLALKLVIGQICILPLSQVLANLEQARGQKTDELYTYIYWQAWQTLDPAGRETLLVMPLVQGGTWHQLAALSELDEDILNQAVEQLVTLSLVDVSGDLEQRRYHIHRLTETFLLNEVAKWQ
jgi:transcriptional regulator with XRE-family HTH domain